MNRSATEDALRMADASVWRIRVQADEGVLRSPDFLAWFADPRNQDAYARACATWDAFEDHLAAPELIRVRRDALHRARRAFLHRLVPRGRRAPVLAACILLAAGAAIAAWQYFRLPAGYTTGIGERRTVLLSDGSRISLDSAAAVEVHYSPTLRQAVLERGRVHFDVAHDVSRPFTVSAGAETVVAVGTSFDVERLSHKVLITLIDGSVIVRSAPEERTPDVARSAATAVVLTAGQQLVAAADARPAISTINLSAVRAWESGRLILDSEPLAEAVERVNRYTDTPLEVDPSVAQIRVSGVFNAGDVAAFIDAITSYFPVRAIRSADGRTLLQKRS